MMILMNDYIDDDIDDATGDDTDSETDDTANNDTVVDVADEIKICATDGYDNMMKTFSRHEWASYSFDKEELRQCLGT